MPINAKLVVVGGEVKTAEIKLRLPSTIGRGRGCTIMLPQALVSRQHCEIFESAGQLMVRDLGSLNGTFVNNQKIAEPSPVNSEELLTIGTVTFRVVYEGAGASSPPAGPGPVMKSSAKETLRAEKGATAPAAAPAEPLINADDSSQPLEIGDFDFEETVRPSSDTVSPAPVTASSKTPSGPLAIPIINIGEPAKKPAAPAPLPVVATKPVAPIPAPAANPAAKPMPPAPAAKPVPPAAGPAAPPAAPAAKAPESEEEAEQEDDFQDFLKSLGK